MKRQALVVAENAPPLIAQLRRCVDGRSGRALLEQQRAARARVGAAREDLIDLSRRTASAVSYAQQHRLSPTPTAPDVGIDLSGSTADGSPRSHDRNDWQW